MLLQLKGERSVLTFRGFVVSVIYKRLNLVLCSTTESEYRPVYGDGKRKKQCRHAT